MGQEVSFTFRPNRFLRGAHWQTLLASVGPRRRDVARRAAAVLAASEDRLLDCGDGVRLLAHVSRHDGADRDVVVMLHGWEGSAGSQYLLSAAAHFFAAGYTVVRLNLRDHGPTHHLNEELFHSCRIDEVVGAVQAISRSVPHRRILFLGYSLGGNFGLRVALRAPGVGLRLDGVAAICPVLDPHNTMERLEQGPLIYRRYFAYKWARSLARKREAWPGVFEFDAILKDRRLSAMTQHLVAAYTSYPSTADYLNGYALVGTVLAPLEVPALVIAAADDPIIPASDFARLAQATSLCVDLQQHGGHCGFLRSLSGPSWADERVLDWFGRLS